MSICISKDFKHVIYALFVTVDVFYHVTQVIPVKDDILG